MSYTIQQIAQVLKSKSPVTGEGLIDHILTDSRQLTFPATTIFFALKGARRDGHIFIEELYEKGVRYFVISDPVNQDAFPDAVFIEVSNTLIALQTLAGFQRKQFNIPVIGITGSNGKTIVKEWLSQLLHDDYRILRSPKSYNSQIGVPLSVWPLNESHQLAIFEAGISQSGEMERLKKVIEPTIGIFTNIGSAHSEGFLNNRQKVNEKLRLFTDVSYLIYCKDDPEVQQAVAALWQQLSKGQGTPFTIINWSTVSEASLQILTLYKDEGKTLISAVWKGETIDVSIPFTDAASIENAIHCWCLLLHLGISSAIIKKRMAQLIPVAMRLELKKGINHCSIINDSYSADLNSLKIALDFLTQQRQQEKSTVILSDILESGLPEKELYQQVAAALQQRQVTRLIGIGERITLNRGLFDQVQGMETLFFKTTENFLAAFQQLTFKEETVLLKGARVFAFEQIDRLLVQQQHQTLLEINLNALISNVKQYQQLLKPGVKVMAMVKAFAYGGGSFEIARVLQYHKIDYLAVAYTDEGVALRKAGIHLPIMVMNVEDAGFDALLQYNLEPDLYSIDLVKTFADFLSKQGIRHFPVHIELETGMNRLGIAGNELPVLSELLLTDLFKVQSVFSHLVASEDKKQDDFTQKQLQLFTEYADKISALVPYGFLRHIANTSGISRHPELQLDMVRLGIGMYGIDDNQKALQEVSTLRSTVAQIKKVAKGESVGYGHKEVSDKNRTIATIRIGYADGYPRNLSYGVGKVWVNGVIAPVIGTVCMDMTMVDISEAGNVKEGDTVILFGKEISVKQVAQWAQTIPYEILTGVSTRVKRVYFEE